MDADRVHWAAMHPFDRYFFNPSLGNAQMARAIPSIVHGSEHHGIDAPVGNVPKQGIDDRNQFDMTRPFQVGLTVPVWWWHNCMSVKVLLPHNAWDHRRGVSNTTT